MLVDRGACLQRERIGSGTMVTGGHGGQCGRKARTKSGPVDEPTTWAVIGATKNKFIWRMEVCCIISSGSRDAPFVPYSGPRSVAGEVCHHKVFGYVFLPVLLRRDLSYCDGHHFRPTIEYECKAVDDLCRHLRPWACSSGSGQLICQTIEPRTERQCTSRDGPAIGPAAFRKEAT